MKSIYGKFKEGLELFAKKHRKEISKNPALRVHFQKMCANIGVDPLASSKGFWAEILGIGDFYYELGVKIVEACLRLREQTGGLIDIRTLKKRLANGEEISDEDILKAIEMLKPLESGFKVIKVGSRIMVQSVPRELSTDTSSVLDLTEKDGFITCENITQRIGWTKERADLAISALIDEGLVWIDDQATPKQFWVPGLFAGIA